MESLTLREAAKKSSRSITTLRRYIRGGRLRAEKRQGRFGPEYFVTGDDLRDAGLDPPAASVEAATEPVRQSSALPRARRGTDRANVLVPLPLYQDLQMKHEQLLVQYGMMRAGGLRVLEQQAEIESRQKELEESRAHLERLRRHVEQESARLQQKLRKANLELEGRSLEIAALREKVRTLEMLTRNAETNDTIEKQFRRVVDQERLVEDLSSRGQASAPDPTRSTWRPPTPSTEQDH